MGLVVIEGLLIAVLVITGFRQAVFRAIPGELKAAIAAGIGLFIALIGFVDGGLVRRIPDAAGTTVPVQLGGDGTLRGGVAIPAFLTMVLMPFMYSITNGIGAGFISWVAIRVVRGRARQIHPLMWAVSAAFLIYFGINVVKAIAGVG